MNGDNSYNSETGWGYQSEFRGCLHRLRRRHQPVRTRAGLSRGRPVHGHRTTPDVSLVADPATGAWIADSYNLDPSNPFEVVGGTSLSAPASAALLALVNQGRAAAGELGLNSSMPTDAQQALYMLPQTDYNAIDSGTNGYTAGAGYNLVTGLGTPVANLFVPDLVAYQGPGTTYSGQTVAPLQDAGLVYTGSVSNGPMDVFSVFDSLTTSGAVRGRANSPVGRFWSQTGSGPTGAGGAESRGVGRGPGPRRPARQQLARVFIGDLAFEQIASVTHKAPRGAVNLATSSMGELEK